MCLSRFSCALLAFVLMLTPVLLAQEEPRQLAEAGYRIAGGDTIQITVWMNSENTRVVLVNREGNINLPIGHKLKVSGMTSAELARLIHDKLEGTVRNPQVTVRVVRRLSEPLTPPLPGVRSKPKVPPSPELRQKCCVS